MSAIIKIELSQGLTAKVDVEDAPGLSFQHWHAVDLHGILYAVTWKRLPNGKRKRMFMHRAILRPNDNIGVDHANGDGLDNRRCNLREATHSQNGMNSRKRKGTASKYKGVTYDGGRGKKWRARIMKDRTEIYLGRHDTEEDAALAYNAAAKQLFGEFARLNQIAI